MAVQTFLAPVWEPKPLDFGDGSHLDNIREVIRSRNTEKSSFTAMDPDASEEERRAAMSKLLSINPDAHDAILYQMATKDKAQKADQHLQLQQFGKISAVLSQLSGDEQMTGIQKELAAAQERGDDLVASEMAELLGMDENRRDIELRSDAAATEMGLAILNRFDSDEQTMDEANTKEREVTVKEGELAVKQQVANTAETETAAKIKLDRDEFEAELKKGPNQGKVTDTQRTAKGFSVRMVRASKIVDKLEASNFNPASFGQSLLSLTNTTSTNESQKYTQAAKDWMRAKLRKESGAVISSEEIDNEWETYFPMFGDGEAVILQKKQARLNAEKQMSIGSGALAEPEKLKPTPEQARQALQRRRGQPPRG